ncbi:MAG: glycosyltransferase [Patescibacteria group bacterium]
MLLSVIIPTHRRRDTLRLCLECLAKQSILRSFDRLRTSSAQDDTMEVIVVSDGPDEKTAEMIQSLPWPFQFQYFAIPKSQQGVARNRAAEKARGKYALLIGDDIFLARDACEVHLRAHEGQRTMDPSARLRTGSGQWTKDQRLRPSSRMAVLGHTTWDPTLRITPLMQWMEQSGVQFGYPKLAAHENSVVPQNLQHWFTYTSNLSLPTHLLRHHPFREDISLYGWEDVEWGRRLALAGINLLYEPAAKGYHHHPFTDQEVWERSRKLGFSAMEMEKLVPRLRLQPQGLKKLAYRLFALLPIYKGKHCRAFLRGMREAGRGPGRPL